MSEHERYALGIDVGTTSVKVTLLNPTTQDIVFTQSKHTCAQVDSDIGALGFEQDAGKILKVVQECIEEIPRDLQAQVKGIGITGQMHGVMLWSGSHISNCQHDLKTMTKTSYLYTWMDQRCTPEFLATLPSPSSHLKVATGHGCASLFWLTRNKKEIIHSEGYDCSGSIMDYIVARLCRLTKPVTSVQIAASFGYFHPPSKSWNKEILSASGFPVHLLPDVVSPGQIAGFMTSPLSVIPSDIPVYAALGDVQCAFFSIIQTSQDAVLNLSTSVQIGYVAKGVNSKDPSWLQHKPETVEYFPYFGDSYLALSAGLNGGNVLQEFVLTLQSWMAEFGMNRSETEIWSKLLGVAKRCDEPTISVKPTLFGERHDPSLQASVTGLAANNTTLGNVFKATCYGIIDNLSTLMSSRFLIEAGITRLLASGTVISHNSIVRERLETLYSDVPIVYGNSGDSAIGAAKIVKL